MEIQYIRITNKNKAYIDLELEELKEFYLGLKNFFGEKIDDFPNYPNGVRGFNSNSNNK